MKKVLILGKNSYLGESLFKWLSKAPEKYDVYIISSLNYEWKNADYSNVDAVVNFAGIAHINKITEDMRDLFYSVNGDLCVEMAQWAKLCGVKQFITFSSMNVYGDFVNGLTDRDKVHPTSFYGDSKLAGDTGVLKLSDLNFSVACIRPPFVYGRGCKGNYNAISRIVKKTFIFPTYKNKKSMIYIDNLCEFIRLIIDDCAGGVFTPQNKELKSTYELAKAIANVSGKRVWFTGLFNWLVAIAKKPSKTVRRAFSNDFYDLSISDYYNFDYCVVDFESSIKETED